MIKNMLKGRKESDTYLATFHRHCWSAQMTMKKDNLFELPAITVPFISCRQKQRLEKIEISELPASTVAFISCRQKQR